MLVAGLGQPWTGLLVTLVEWRGGVRWVRMRQRHFGVHSDERIEVSETGCGMSVIEQGSESAGDSVFGASR